MRAGIVAGLAGTLFGAGLALARMTDPAVVKGFLDLAGDWNPSLAFVMGSALAVSAVAQRLRRHASAPSGAGVDARLLAGAALFGLGWGLAGLCPGPAVAALVTGSGEVALFAAAMLAGMGLHGALMRRRADRGPATAR